MPIKKNKTLYQHTDAKYSVCLFYLSVVLLFVSTIDLIDIKAFYAGIDAFCSR